MTQEQFNKPLLQEIAEAQGTPLMTQQEMEARIEKLEKQVLFLASLSTTVSMGFSAMAGKLPTKEDIELSVAIMHNFSKAGLTKETVKELFK